MISQPGKWKCAKIMYQSEATTQIGNEVDSYGAQVSIHFSSVNSFTRIEFEMKSESQIQNKSEPKVLKLNLKRRFI